MHAPRANPVVYNDITSHVVELNSFNGSCIVIHTQQLIVAVATTRRQIVLTSLQNTIDGETPTHSGSKFTILASKHLAFQGLKWLDEQNILAFHIKGFVVQWTFQRDFLGGNSYHCSSPSTVIVRGLRRERPSFYPI